MSIPVAETERLILREWRPEDIDAYAEMNADPDVRRYMFPDRPLSHAEAEAEIEAEVDRWEKLSFGHRPVVLKATGEVIGRAGAKRHPDYPLDPLNTEVGWLFKKTAWGNGYATEAALEVARYLRDDLAVPELISMARLGNEPSFRVMEKVGLERVGPYFWKERDVEIVLYRTPRAG